jgi:hypothetical protein
MSSPAAGHLRRRGNVSGRAFLVGRLVDVSDGHADYHDHCRSGRCLFPFWPQRYRPPWDRYPSGRETETPLDILKKRYARGEIKKEEFDQMKKDLS